MYPQKNPNPIHDVARNFSMMMGTYEQTNIYTDFFFYIYIKLKTFAHSFSRSKFKHTVFIARSLNSISASTHAHMESTLEKSIITVVAIIVNLFN